MLAYPDAQLLDVTGPLEVFAIATRLLAERGRADPGYSVEVVASRIAQLLSSPQEQAKQGDQILQAIQVFRESVTESNHRRTGMQESLSELSERARVLDEEVGRFRI